MGICRKTAVRILALGLLAGMLLLLSGCQVLLLPFAKKMADKAQEPNPGLDARVEALLDAVARDDEEAFTDMFYPGRKTEEELQASFALLRRMGLWEQEYDLRFMTSNPISQITADEDGNYSLRFADGSACVLMVTWVSDEEGEGFVSLSMVMSIA